MAADESGYLEEVKCILRLPLLAVWDIHNPVDVDETSSQTHSRPICGVSALSDVRRERLSINPCRLPRPGSVATRRMRPQS